MGIQHFCSTSQLLLNVTKTYMIFLTNIFNFEKDEFNIVLDGYRLD